MAEFSKSLLSSPIYWILMVICILIIFICLKFGNKIIGWFGEKWTKDEINKLPKDKYKILNDIMIMLNGKTYQIDHIVVSCYGIFVIETKQYNGVITGSKYDKYWVRHIGNKKCYYTNPIKQNYGHMKAICELLNINDNKVVSLVNVTSNAKLKVDHDGELVRNYSILEKIYSYKTEIISNVDEIVEKILDNNITDKRIRKEHIESIRNKYVDDKDISTCPKCGSILKERTGKYGKFLGCSNYPNCKYTRDIKQNQRYNVLEDDKEKFINIIKNIIIFFFGLFLIIFSISFFINYTNGITNNVNTNVTDNQKKTIDSIKEAYTNSKEKGFELIHTNTCNEISGLFGSSSFKCDRLPLIINYINDNTITIYKDFNLYTLELNEDNSIIKRTNKKYVGNYNGDGVAVGYLYYDETNEYYKKIGGIDKIKEMATYAYTNNAFVSKYYDSSHVEERGGEKYNNYKMIVDMYFSALTGRGYDIKASSTNKEETNKMCEAFYYIMK